MKLNTLKPKKGSKKLRTRVGRGIGCGFGKTCGYGHKGQKARSGYARKRGFEGGQMPMQRRLPKFGFRSKLAAFADEITLNNLASMGATEINLASLKKAKLIDSKIKKVKVILSGKLGKPVNLKGLKVTKGARQIIEKLGGKIED